MIKNLRRGIPNLFKNGTKHLAGLEEAVQKNIDACKALSDLTRTSMGPQGMNKMIINHLNKLFVTSDAGTLLHELDIQHPAAKMIVMAAEMQDTMVGDGTNFLISFAGELLSHAEALIKMGLHPSEIVKGYEQASRRALEILEELTLFEVKKTDMQDAETLSRCIRSAIQSKEYGYGQHLSDLVAKAAMQVMPKNPYNFNVDNVRVVAIKGGSMADSHVINGFVVKGDTSSIVKDLTNAKVAVYTCSIQIAETETKGTILLHDDKELLAYSASEETEIEKILTGVKNSGVNVIVTAGSIDDMAMHFINKLGLLAIKLKSKFELRRLCRATKSRPLVNLTPTVAKEHQGFASRVYVQEIANKYMTVFEQQKRDVSLVSTIVLMASTDTVLKEVERGIDDGVNVVRGMTRNGKFLAGGGACDIELARRLDEEAVKIEGLDQYAIRKYGQAFEVVPRTLAENAGLNSTEFLAELYAAHENKQTHAGIDVDEGTVADYSNKEVVDLYFTKAQAIRLATDAVLTILRVDQIIWAKQAGGPKPGQKPGYDAE